VIAFVLPTRDRSDELARTLSGLGDLGLGPELAEVVVVDNASAEPAVAPARLACGAPVTLLRRETNEGAAARNAGVEACAPHREWVVMLDDDSCPLPDAIGVTPFAERLRARPADVLAVTADIHLDRARGRERGGLPEVFIGCGVAIRRSAFLDAGGYDPAFGYYAEEYDLAAKLLAAGGRVEFDPAWRVEHRKVDAGRDMNLIVERLVRNTSWVMRRYAPDAVRDAEVRRVIERCAQIAANEDARSGFDRGLAELERTIDAQVGTPLDADSWDRFTGRAAARSAVAEVFAGVDRPRAAVVLEGKNGSVVRAALAEAGVEVAPGVPGPGVPLVIGTLSPGPMLDGLDLLEPLGRGVVAPWPVARAAVRTARDVAARPARSRGRLVEA